MTVESETTWEPKTVASLLRGLAIDVEQNPPLAARVARALADLGLVDGPAAGDTAGGDLAGIYAARLDLLGMLRQGGEEPVRERLATLDLASLRRVIQVQRLDPQRLATRLRSAAKLVDFIVDRLREQIDREREVARSASWML